MKNVLLVLGGVAIGGVGAYFFCKARQKKKDELILSLVKDEKTKKEINGYQNQSSGKLTVKTEEGQTFKINNIPQLSYQQPSPISTGNYNCSDKSCEVSKKKYGFPVAQDCDRQCTTGCLPNQ